MGQHSLHIIADLGWHRKRATKIEEDLATVNDYSNCGASDQGF
jgi:hypothetical protein